MTLRKDWDYFENSSLKYCLGGGMVDTRDLMEI